MSKRMDINNIALIFVSWITASHGFLEFFVSTYSGIQQRFVCNSTLTTGTGLLFINVDVMTSTTDKLEFNSCHCLMFLKDNAWPPNGDIYLQRNSQAEQVEYRRSFTEADFATSEYHALEFTYFVELSEDGRDALHMLQFRTHDGNYQILLNNYLQHFSISNVDVSVSCDPNSFVDSRTSGPLETTISHSTEVQDTTFIKSTTSFGTESPVTTSTVVPQDPLFPSSTPFTTYSGSSSSNKNTIIQAVVIPVTLIAVLGVFIGLCYIRKRRLRASRIQKTNGVAPKEPVLKTNGCCIKTNLSNSMEEFASEERLKSGCSDMSSDSNYVYVNGKHPTRPLNNLNSVKIENHASITDNNEFKNNFIHNGIDKKGESNIGERNISRPEFKLI